MSWATCCALFLSLQDRTSLNNHDKRNNGTYDRISYPEECMNVKKANGSDFGDVKQSKVFSKLVRTQSTNRNT